VRTALTIQVMNTTLIHLRLRHICFHRNRIILWRRRTIPLMLAFISTMSLLPTSGTSIIGNKRFGIFMSPGYAPIENTTSTARYKRLFSSTALNRILKSLAYQTLKSPAHTELLLEIWASNFRILPYTVPIRYIRWLNGTDGYGTYTTRGGLTLS